MQIARLFEMIYLLLNRKTMTSGELAEYFEVSRRTIYRDIEVLTQAGIPIYTSRGKNGGIGILDTFVLNKALLSGDEQKELLAALQSLEAADYKIAPIASKLSSFFNQADSNWIQVDFSDWSNMDNRFNIIKTAILERRRITFEYFNRNGGHSFREVEPLQLRFKHKSWYLVGFCLTREDYRTFKIARMNQPILTDTDGHFIRGLPPEVSEEGPPMEMPPLIVLKVDSSQAFRIFDMFELSCVHQEEDGNFTIHAAYEQDEALYGYILSMGHHVQVLAPDNLREEIALRIKKAYEAHQI